MAAIRVQNYLKKHKIGPLFESLMASVIQDTPDDPIGYIIEILQVMHKKQSKQLESSFNNHMSPRSSLRQTNHPQSGGNKRRSDHNLAASWSAGVDRPESKKQENQLRTWTGNYFKTIKNETWSGDRQESKPSWNNDTRVPTKDFDELFQMQNEGAAQIKSSPNQDIYRGVRSWDDGESRRSEQKISYEADDNDELSRELRLKSKQSDKNIHQPVSMTSGGRSIKTSRQAVEKHRKELQALLLEDGPGKKRRSTKNSSPEERGTEIMERMEDLQNEGVNETPSLKGAKLDKLKRMGNKEVSVTICARCARIIGDNDNSLSEAERGDFNSRLFDDLNKKQDLNDLDSASETSGNMGLRERNTWPLSDSEQLTPRNTVSFNKTFDRSFPNGSENGFNNSSDIFDDDIPVETQRSSRSKTSSRSRNSHFDFTKAAGNSGWGLGGDESDNESNYSDTMQPRSKSQVSGSIKGRAWNRNSGNISDDDSTMT
ncbi:uncharacterized protein C8orf34-like isoform X2 [Dendronephthya gigantea]|uniref:uncharacterized protein C8orf34-like isoform X2 n=2 Tax=Dendronephthya gigantea TaxID=151771 RepID=UPI00106A6375|nr:uncharacterized protein C8orf34-like isoform X2 [Dendronephthya gigantea]